MRLTDSVSPLDWSEYFKNFLTLISILLFCLERFWSNFSINLRCICGRISALPFSTMDLNLEQILTKEWYLSNTDEFLVKSGIISASFFEVVSILFIQDFFLCSLYVSSCKYSFPSPCLLCFLSNHDCCAWSSFYFVFSEKSGFVSFCNDCNPVWPNIFPSELSTFLSLQF